MLPRYDAPPATARERTQGDRRRERSFRLETAALLAWFVVGGVYSGATFSRLDRRFFTAPTGNDVWFEADMPAVSDAMLHRWGDHARNAHHPLFALVTTVPANGLRAIGLAERSRLTIIVALSAAVWSATIFMLLRLLTPTMLDACVFTLLTHVSAASVFFLPTTETVVLGSATLLAPLVLLAADYRRRASDRWYVAASAVSLSMTTTSWMSGIVAAAAGRRLRTAVQVTANALVVVVLLWAVQKTLVPRTQFFIEAAEHSRFLMQEEAGGPIPRLRALLVHSMVMPAVQTTVEPKWGRRMSVQYARVGSSGPAGQAATVLWIGLLGVGLWSVGQRHVHPVLRRTMIATLIGQCALYFSYGEETFLYSLYVVPLFIACAATATVTPLRRWIRVLAIVLIALAALNNARAFAVATDFFNGSIGAGTGPF